MAGYKDNFDNIVIPSEHMDRMIHQAINKAKGKKKLRRRIAVSMFAVLICASILGSGFFSTSMAEVLEKLPFIGSVFEREKFAGRGLENIDKNDISTFDGLQVNDNGTTIAIKEFYYDQSGFTIGYEVNGKKLNHDKIFRPHFYYNGRPIAGGGGGSHEKVSEEQYFYLNQFSPDEVLCLPDQFELEVVLSDDLRTTKTSPYRFKIPVSRFGADAKTRALLVMKASNTEDRTILVKKVTFTPLATVLDYECTYPSGSANEVHDYANVKLVTGSGLVLEPRAAGWESLNGELLIDKCRVEFPAINDPQGNMALELMLPNNQNIRVEFEVKL